MKMRLATGFLVIASLFSPMAVHAEDRDADRAHPMTFVKDSIITTKVKAMLAEEEMKTLLHIKVDTDSKGAVLLSGTARTQEDADKAVSITRKVEGVTSVTSKIRIKKED